MLYFKICMKKLRSDNNNNNNNNDDNNNNPGSRLLCSLLLGLVVLQSAGYGLLFVPAQVVFRQIAAYIISNPDFYAHTLVTLEIAPEDKNPTITGFRQIDKHEIELYNERYDIVRADSSQQNCIRLLVFPDKSETLLFKLLKKYREDNAASNKDTSRSHSAAGGGNGGVLFFFPVWIHQPLPCFLFFNHKKAPSASDLKTLLPPYIVFWSPIAGKVPYPPPKLLT